jgi:hypothetical protein
VHVVDRRVEGSVLGWVVAVTAGWCVVALAVGIVLGRVLRMRDRQVPHHARPVPPIPSPRRSVDPAVERDREPG